VPTRLQPAALVAALILATTAAAQDTKPKTSFTGDLGYVTASGNTNLTTLSVGDKLTHSDGRWLFTQVAAYVYGESDSKESANQLRIGGRADFDFKPRIGVFAAVSYERNTFAGFKSRTDEVLGLLWKAIVAPRDSMTLDAGGELTQQANVDGTNQSYPAARFGLNYKHTFTKAAYFQQLADYAVDLQSGGGYRVNTESALVAPISAHIGIKVSYGVRFNSAPPTGFGTTDRVLTTGVQVSF
jgi:putative salt-induced outer membrane protein